MDALEGTGPAPSLKTAGGMQNYFRQGLTTGNRRLNTHWQILQTFANCVSSFRLYKPSRRPHSPRGHPLSQRQLL